MNSKIEEYSISTILVLVQYGSVHSRVERQTQTERIYGSCKIEEKWQMVDRWTDADADSDIDPLSL